MKPKVTDLLSLLEEIAPSAISEDWDNPGLQVGSLQSEIDRILVSLDPTLDGIRDAKTRKAQVLLTHHPLLFKPISCLNEDIYPGNVIHEAVIGGISIVALHTNLDSAANGINTILANMLALEDTVPMRRIPEIAEAGLGRLGSLPKPLGLSQLVAELKTALSAERIRIVGWTDTPIRRVAVVGGAGGSMISRAAELGADVFVTGDITYHQALEAKALHLPVIDAGHYCTEHSAFLHFAASLRQVLQEKRFETGVEVYGGEKDPFSYV